MESNDVQKTDGGVWSRLAAWWHGLTTTQQTIIIVIVGVVVLAMLASWIIAGTDYAGFGEWVLQFRG